MNSKVFSFSAMALMVQMLVVCIEAGAATVILNCNVGGARLEYGLPRDRTLCHTGSFPQVIANVRRYDYIMIRATAPGYETWEQGYEVPTSGANTLTINLEPENLNPLASPLFGIDGQIVSKRGLKVLPKTYKVVCRNLTTYKKSDGPQVSQDINYNDGSAGNFCGVFANFATNRAVAAGDSIFVGVFNSSLTRCYGHTTRKLSEDEVANAGIVVTIFVP